ncbi:TonB-dependent siderophore receptor [Erwinia sp. AnSW2-5]|uniref:TonB-dependent siderophore receptor n=1 Tax=Erwinia sp. AnSW2-5 TaxID=3367692 RepID=UPI00385CFA10
MTLVFNLKRSVLCCTIAMTAPGMTFAADSQMVVTAAPAETADSPTNGYTATTSTGASKTDQPLITTGQSVSVVTRQQIDDQAANTVGQALNYTPGVFSNFSGGATRFDTIALRGFHGGDVDNLFLDGMRLMSDGGSHNIMQVDPWFLERLDIIKGPSSALYGQTVPGGLVNMTSKRPQFAPEGHFRLTGGTQNTKGAAFDYTNAINDQWAFRLIGMTRTSDTQYDNTREERYAISPSLLWQPSEETSLLLRAYLQKDPSGGYHGSTPLSGNLTQHNGQWIKEGFNEGESSVDQYKRREQVYSYAFSHRFNETWAVRSDASYTHSSVALDQVYQNGWIGDSNQLARGYSGSRGSLDAWSTDNQLEADFATGEVKHKVVVGAEYHQYKNDVWSGYGSASPLNPFTGVTASHAVDVTYQDNTTRRYYQSGIYLQDELEWNRWHATLSGRYDRMVSEQDNHTIGVKNRMQDDHISGRASLLYAFENGVSPYVSYSQAVTPSILPGADGNLLKPSTAEQYEAGVKYQPPGTSNMYTAALYDLTQKDVATRDANDIASATYIPAGKVHSQGIELEARNQLTPRLSTVAGYTLNRLRYKASQDGNDGHTPLLAPNQMASAWAHYQFDYGISARAGVRYIGKQWANDENTARIPSVTLVDASVRADLGDWNSSMKGAYVQVNANNLLGRDYIAACYSTTNCYVGAERSVLATVGYDF